MTIKFPTLHRQMGILQDTIARQQAAIAEEAPQIPPGEVKSRRARLIVIRNEMIKLSSHILSICTQIKASYERRAYLYSKFASQIEPDDAMGAGGGAGAAAPAEYIPEEAIIAELEALEKEEARLEGEYDKLKELYAILKQIIDLRKQKGGYKKRATRRVKKTRRSKSRR